MILDQNSSSASDIIFDYPDIPFSTGPRPWPLEPVTIIAGGTIGNTINLLGGVGVSSPLAHSDQTPLKGE